MSKLQLTSAIKDEFNPDTATYPLMGFRKYDGVRAGHLHGFFHGRSLDPFANIALNAKFNGPQYAGFDGELVYDGLLTNETLDGETLCSLTTGLTNRSKLKKGETELPTNGSWALFDLLTPETMDLEYLSRWNALASRVKFSSAITPGSVMVAPWVWINSPDEARAWIAECLELLFEGAIFRDPKAKHKSGRATATKNDFWRFKPTSDKDAIITGAYEAMANNNEATTNSRGRTERSAHKENKVGKGTLGGFFARDVETGQPIKIPAGAMKHKERDEVWAAWLAEPESLVGRPCKYCSLDTGVKDAPRQGRWISWRSKEDMLKDTVALS